MNDWLEVLQSACRASSLRKVARELEVSPALISLVLRNKYHASLTFLQNKVEQALQQKLTCPVLGELTAQECRHYQEMDFCAHNPLKVSLYKACRQGCEHYQTKEKHHGGNTKN